MKCIVCVCCGIFVYAIYVMDFMPYVAVMKEIYIILVDFYCGFEQG